MSTATKEVETLGRTRQGLVDEGQRLREEGARRQLQGQPTGDISQWLEAIDSEMRGLNDAYKAARRVAAGEAAAKLGSDRQFQALLLGALQPFIALADVVEAQRGKGVGLPPLPATLARIAAEGRAYLEALARIGAMKGED